MGQLVRREYPEFRDSALNARILSYAGVVNVSADWHVLSAVSGTPERPGLVDCGHDVLCS